VTREEKRRIVAEEAARVTESCAPPPLRERAFLRAMLALRECRCASTAVRDYVRRMT
jgi:hypothetical protein